MNRGRHWAEFYPSVKQPSGHMPWKIITPSTRDFLFNAFNRWPLNWYVRCLLGSKLVQTSSSSARKKTDRIICEQPEKLMNATENKLAGSEMIGWESLRAKSVRTSSRMILVSDEWIRGNLSPSISLHTSSEQHQFSSAAPTVFYIYSHCGQKGGLLQISLLPIKTRFSDLSENKHFDQGFAGNPSFTLEGSNHTLTVPGNLNKDISYFSTW